MGMSADAKIVYGVQIRSDRSLVDEYKSITEFMEEVFENDISSEDEEEYGITTEFGGYEYDDKFLVIKHPKSDTKKYSDGRLIWACDYGCEKFDASVLQTEKTPEWDEQFKRFCADKGIPFVQPSYWILAQYG